MRPDRTVVEEARTMTPDEVMMTDRIEKLWDELIYTHGRVATGPTSDRRTIAFYRDGLLTAYAIITGESEAKVRTDLMENETKR